MDARGDEANRAVGDRDADEPAPDIQPSFLIDTIPDDAPADAGAAALRERIYGSIACLSTLLVITGYEPLQHPWAQALEVLTAAGGFWAASVFAEYVAHIGAHKVTPGRAELRHMLWATGQIMAASLLPLLLLVLAGIHALSLHAAVWSGVWVLVVELGLFAFLAVRRTPLAWWARALLVVVLMLLGVVVVLLKSLAH